MIESLVNSSAFPYVSAAAIGLAIFFVIWSLGTGASEIIEESEYVSVERQGILVYLTPLIRRLTPFTMMVQGKGLNDYRKALPKTMTRAGLEGFMTPEEYIAFHLLCGLLTIPMVLWVNFLILGAKPVSMVLSVTPVFCIGAYYPRLYMIGRVNSRQKSVFRDLPYVMDLLTVSVEAGLDFQGGLAKVVEKGKDGALREELKRMLNQMKLGTTRIDALRELNERVGLRELGSFCSALIQAAKLGSSIGPILRIQSEMLRTKRSQVAEELANKAPVKMIFPIVAFIFPSVFLVLLGPVVIKAWYRM
jgi:tight adherence protein C